MIRGHISCMRSCGCLDDAFITSPPYAPGCDCVCMDTVTLHKPRSSRQYDQTRIGKKENYIPAVMRVPLLLAAVAAAAAAQTQAFTLGDGEQKPLFGPEVGHDVSGPEGVGVGVHVDTPPNAQGPASCAVCEVRLSSRMSWFDVT